MNKLSVIGNNIANVNTNGYKTQRTVFRDALYTMYSGGSDGTATVGSKNPAQIGYGSQVASIDLNMTTATLPLATQWTVCSMGMGSSWWGTRRGQCD
ncbi:MAG: flagellar basal body protein [Oscillospiraceae bacterium]